MSVTRTRLLRLFWVFFEKFGLVGLSIFSFFIFATYLTPLELGLGILLLSVVEFFSMFLIAIVDSSIIRLKHISKENDGTTFWLLFLCSALLAVIIFGFYYLYFEETTILLAGLIAVFLLPFQSISRIHIIHLRRKKSFKQLANRTILGKLAGMSLGIYLAINDFGEMAIVAQATAMAAVSTGLLFITDRRQLPFIFDFKWAYEQLRIGIPASLKVVNTSLYSKGAIFIIEGVLGTQAVGFYNFANRLVELPRTAILTALMGYAHPVFSDKKNRGEALESFFLSSTKIGLMLIVPLFVGLALISEPLISGLFGEKWLPAIPLLIGIAILTSINLIFIFLPSLLLANNKTKLGLKGQVISSISALGILWLLLEPLGMTAILYALFTRVIILVPVNLYSLVSVTKDITAQFGVIILKLIIASTVMSLVVLSTRGLFENISPLLDITLSVIVGAFSYILSYLVLNKTISSELKAFISK